MKSVLALFLSLTMLIGGFAGASAESAALDPQTDFYGYATQALLAEHPPVEDGITEPAELETEGWTPLLGLIDSIAAEEDAHLRALLSDPSSADPAMETDQILAAAVRLLQDHEGRNATGTQVIAPYVTQIMAAETVADVMQACIALQAETGLGLFYDLSASSDEETCVHYPNIFCELYTLHSALGDELDAQRERCLALLTRIFVKLGYTQEQAAAYAEAELAFDTALDTAEEYDGDEVDTLAELDALLPALMLPQALGAMGIEDASRIEEGCVTSDLYRLNTVATDENLEGLKCFAVVNLFSAVAPYMDDEAVSLGGELVALLFYGFPQTASVLSASMTEEEMLAMLRAGFSTEICDNYGDRHMTAALEKTVRDGMEDVFDWYRARIKESTWMSDETKQASLDKIDQCLVFVGKCGVSPYHDAQAASWAEMFLSGKKAKQDQTVQLITDPDFYRSMWSPEAQADKANAAYDNTTNAVHICAGILQEPFYSLDAGKGENAAGLMFILAHECSHAFDPEGSMHDGLGRKQDLWTEADRATYESLTEKVKTYYAHFPYDGQNVQDTSVTLAENCADLAAIRFVMDWLDTDEEKQAALERFAQCWFGSHSTIWYEVLQGESHSFPRTRVNGVVASMEDFYRIYGVSEGNAMYVPADERPAIWE